MDLEKRRERNRNYYYRHRERLLQYKKIYNEKPEVKIHQREYNQKNKKERAKWFREHRKKLKIIYIQMLGGKCQSCGYDKCIAALEFHHINQNEKESINDPKRKNFGQKIQEGKIQLLCSNCHKELHFGDEMLYGDGS